MIKIIKIKITHNFECSINKVYLTHNFNIIDIQTYICIFQSYILSYISQLFLSMFNALSQNSLFKKLKDCCLLENFYSSQNWRKCFLSWSILEQRNPTDFMMSFKGNRTRWNTPSVTEFCQAAGMIWLVTAPFTNTTIYYYYYYYWFGKIGRDTFAVPLIYAFIGWFLYVPWPRLNSQTWHIGTML